MSWRYNIEVQLAYAISGWNIQILCARFLLRSYIDFFVSKKNKKKLYFSRLQLSESFPLSHAIIYVVDGILRRAKDIFAFLAQDFELCARGTECKLFLWWSHKFRWKSLVTPRWIFAPTSNQLKFCTEPKKVQKRTDLDK